jgi:hypothetical protein
MTFASPEGFSSDEDIDRLKLALDANAAARGDMGSFERTDVAFHYAWQGSPGTRFSPRSTMRWSNG